MRGFPFLLPLLIRDSDEKYEQCRFFSHQLEQFFVLFIVEDLIGDDAIFIVGANISLEFQTE
jgi:hypothetical protein